MRSFESTLSLSVAPIRMLPATFTRRKVEPANTSSLIDRCARMPEHSTSIYFGCFSEMRGSAQKVWFRRFALGLSGLVVPDSCDLLLTLASSPPDFAKSTTSHDRPINGRRERKWSPSSGEETRCPVMSRNDEQLPAPDEQKWSPSTGDAQNDVRRNQGDLDINFLRMFLRPALSCPTVDLNGCNSGGCPLLALSGP